MNIGGPIDSTDGRQATMLALPIGWVTKQVSMPCEQNGSRSRCIYIGWPTIGMTTGVHGIFAGATKFVQCNDILPQEREYCIFSNLGEETVALKEQFPVPIR